MKLKFKLCHELAKVPNKSNPTDVGLDLTAVSRKITADFVEYDTGVAVDVPEGYGGFIFPRSSLSKYGLLLCNSVGVIDPLYNDTIKLRFKITEDGPRLYEVGDRIGQLVIQKYEPVELVQVEDLKGNRGGFGSSDK